MENKQTVMGKFLMAAASCYFWVSLFAVSALLFPIPVILWVTTVLFDRRRYILHQFTCRWSDIILGINPYWKVRVEGREKIDPAKVYVMVSNHQSGLDILVLFKLHRHFKWVAKKGLFAIPFIGWNMALNGYLSIERGRGRSKLQMMDEAAASIGEGNSVMMFPEGTRSPDGRLQTYKTGAFRLALETRTPILPVVLKETHHAIKKGGLMIHKNKRIKLVVLDPIPYESYCGMDSKELATLVHGLTDHELK
ncbi:MAG: 1-acylglycerol-3-phosphate O-acyltransferase, partial [bacterium]